MLFEELVQALKIIVVGGACPDMLAAAGGPKANLDTCRLERRGHVSAMMKVYCLAAPTLDDIAGLLGCRQRWPRLYRRGLPDAISGDQQPDEQPARHDDRRQANLRGLFGEH